MTDDELVIEREMRLEAEAQRESADQWAATMRMERDAMERERDASRALVKEKDAALEDVAPPPHDPVPAGRSILALSGGGFCEAHSCIVAHKSLALTEADMRKRLEMKAC